MSEGSGRKRKPCDLPMKIRRRQSDARWRANVASCYETLKNIIPINKRASKRQISKATILQETHKHIDFLENILSSLLTEKATMDHPDVDPEEFSVQSIKQIKDEFLEKQAVRVQSQATDRKYKRHVKPTRGENADLLVAEGEKTAARRHKDSATHTLTSGALTEGDPGSEVIPGSEVTTPSATVTAGCHDDLEPGQIDDLRHLYLPTQFPLHPPTATVTSERASSIPSRGRGRRRTTPLPVPQQAGFFSSVLCDAAARVQETGQQPNRFRDGTDQKVFRSGADYQKLFRDGTDQKVFRSEADYQKQFREVTDNHMFRNDADYRKVFRDGSGQKLFRDVTDHQKVFRNDADHQNMFTDCTDHQNVLMGETEHRVFKSGADLKAFKSRNDQSREFRGRKDHQRMLDCKSIKQDVFRSGNDRQRMFKRETNLKDHVTKNPEGNVCTCGGNEFENPFWSGTDNDNLFRSGTDHETNTFKRRSDPRNVFRNRNDNALSTENYNDNDFSLVSDNDLAFMSRMENDHSDSDKENLFRVGIDEGKSRTNVNKNFFVINKLRGNMNGPTSTAQRKANSSSTGKSSKVKSLDDKEGIKTRIVTVKAYPRRTKQPQALEQQPFLTALSPEDNRSIAEKSRVMWGTGLTGCLQNNSIIGSHCGPAVKTEVVESCDMSGLGQSLTALKYSPMSRDNLACGFFEPQISDQTYMKKETDSIEDLGFTQLESYTPNTEELDYTPVEVLETISAAPVKASTDNIGFTPVKLPASTPDKFPGQTPGFSESQDGASGTDTSPLCPLLTSPCWSGDNLLCDEPMWISDSDEDQSDTEDEDQLDVFRDHSKSLSQITPDNVDEDYDICDEDLMTCTSGLRVGRRGRKRKWRSSARPQVLDVDRTRIPTLAKPKPKHPRCRRSLESCFPDEGFAATLRSHEENRSESPQPLVAPDFEGYMMFYKKMLPRLQRPSSGRVSSQASSHTTSDTDWSSAWCGGSYMEAASSQEDAAQEERKMSLVTPPSSPPWPSTLTEDVHDEISRQIYRMWTQMSPDQRHTMVQLAVAERGFTGGHGGAQDHSLSEDLKTINVLPLREKDESEGFSPGTDDCITYTICDTLDNAELGDEDSPKPKACQLTTQQIKPHFIIGGDELLSVKQVTADESWLHWDMELGASEELASTTSAVKQEPIQITPVPEGHLDSSNPSNSCQGDFQSQFASYLQQSESATFDDGYRVPSPLLIIRHESYTDN